MSEERKNFCFVIHLSRGIPGIVDDGFNFCTWPLTLDMRAKDVFVALEALFAVANMDIEDVKKTMADFADWAELYRRGSQRSLSMGDLVHEVKTDEWYICRPIGWERVADTDLIRRVDNTVWKPVMRRALPQRSLY